MSLGRFWFTLFYFCQLAFSQATVDEARAWGDFLEWLKKQPAVGATVLIPEYKP